MYARLRAREGSNVAKDQNRDPGFDLESTWREFVENVLHPSRAQRPKGFSARRPICLIQSVALVRVERIPYLWANRIPEMIPGFRFVYFVSCFHARKFDSIQ
jgi:hypothetical protein